MRIIFIFYQKVIKYQFQLSLSICKLFRSSYFGRIFRVPEVCVSYRLQQTVLFLTDSVFRVLFAYFDESMASKIVYKP